MPPKQGLDGCLHFTQVGPEDGVSMVDEASPASTAAPWGKEGGNVGGGGRVKVVPVELNRSRDDHGTFRRGVGEIVGLSEMESTRENEEIMGSF